MATIIIEDGRRQAKEVVAYAYKSAVVKSYPPALLLHVAKNFVHPKLFRRKQDIQVNKILDR